MKKGSILIIAGIVLMLSSFQLNPHYNSTEEYLSSEIDELVAFYKDRHSHPEISLSEQNTSAVLAEKLKELGFEVTSDFGGHGVVGVLKNGKGPTVLYRTDMDALPMYEKTKLPYSSSTEIDYNGSKVGSMHSCGHDVHMTCWLGTAQALVGMKNKWKGTLIMIGQPAEEIGAGAKLMLDEGLYEKFPLPDYGIALHSSPTIKHGQIGIADGYTMAITESITIKVKGKGAHGAAPHMSIDPIVLSSMIVMDLQTIVSRNLKPIDDAVITVGSFQGGVVHNVIPDEVTLKLTVRTFKEDVRQLIHKRIKEICDGIAMAAGLPEEFYPEVDIPKSFTPSNYNDPKLTNTITLSARGSIGAENVLYAEPQLVGEDFSRYGSTSHKIPTVLFWLGTVSKEKIDSGDLPGLHSPFYYPEPEPTIKTGVSVMTAAIIDLMNAKK